MVVVENLPPLQPNTAAIIKQQQQQKQRQSHHHQQKQQQQSKDLLCNSFIVRCWNGETCRYCAEYCRKGVQERCRFPSTQAQTHAHACQNGGAILYRSQEKIVSIFQTSVFVCVCVCVGANVRMCVLWGEEAFTCACKVVDFHCAVDMVAASIKEWTNEPFGGCMRRVAL